MTNYSETVNPEHYLLKAVSVENLRSLQALPSASVEPDLTILAGQNGGGKTSFIDALSLLLSRTSLRKEAQTNQEKDIVVIGEFASADETEAVRVKATQSASRVQLSLACLVHPTFGKPPTDMTLANLRKAFKSVGIESPGGTTKPPFIARATEWINDQPEEDLEEAWIDLPTTVAKRLPQLTVFRSEDAADQPNHVKNLISRESHRLLATEVYVPRLVAIAHDLDEHMDPVLQLIKEMIRRYCPDVTGVNITTEFDFSRVNPQVDTWLTKTTGESIHLNEAGSGLAQQVGLAMYAATLQTLKEAAEESTGSLLAYDEPDTHLDYKAQRDLFEIIRHQSKLSHVQVVVATHSINLIDKVSLQSLRHLRLEGGRTMIELPSNLGGEGESEFVEDLASGLGLRNSVLLSEKCFLVVEGQTEERAIPILFRKIAQETLASAGVTLINTGGSGSVRRMVEVLIQQLKRSVVVLVDEDARTSSSRINGEWLTEMGLAEGTSGFFVGTKEFEDAFDDATWMRVANEQFPRNDGSEWQLADFVDPRNSEHGMGQALANLFSRELRDRVSKPRIGEALARTVSRDEIPDEIRSAVSSVLKMAQEG